MGAEGDVLVHDGSKWVAQSLDRDERESCQGCTGYTDQSNLAEFDGKILCPDCINQVETDQPLPVDKWAREIADDIDRTVIEEINRDFENKP
jgi:hypothetical protein